MSEGLHLVALMLKAVCQFCLLSVSKRNITLDTPHSSGWKFHISEGAGTAADGAGLSKPCWVCISLPWLSSDRPGICSRHTSSASKLFSTSSVLDLLLVFQHDLRYIHDLARHSKITVQERHLAAYVRLCYLNCN